MPVRVTYEAGALPQMEKRVRGLVELAAGVSLMHLQMNLSADAGVSGPRTGVKYAKYPRRSSRTGEFPQEQSGRLLASLGMRETSDGFEVGSLTPPPYAYILEFGPTEDLMKPPEAMRDVDYGDQDDDDFGVGRPFLSKNMRLPNVHEEMNQRIREEVQ